MARGPSSPPSDSCAGMSNLTSHVTSVESLRASLDRAGRLAPQDDRVWLGRANLAIRTADLDEAGRRIDACLSRRPDDAPAWRARLDHAMSTGRADVVRRALGHLLEDEATPVLLQRIRACLAARSGDPGDLPGRGAETDRLRARYAQLHERTQPFRDAEELAGLAERLGRSFEARAFLTLAVSENPDRQDLRLELRRLSRAQPPASAHRRTLAELLAVEGEGDRLVPIALERRSQGRRREMILTGAASRKSPRRWSPSQKVSGLGRGVNVSRRPSRSTTTGRARSTRARSSQRATSS